MPILPTCAHCLPQLICFLFISLVVSTSVKKTLIFCFLCAYYFSASISPQPRFLNTSIFAKRAWRSVLRGHAQTRRGDILPSAFEETLQAQNVEGYPRKRYRILEDILTDMCWRMSFKRAFEDALGYPRAWRIPSKARLEGHSLKRVRGDILQARLGGHIL